MLGIEIKTENDNYSIVRVYDADGLVCSYCGFDSWPFLCLLEEYKIDCR